MTTPPRPQALLWGVWAHPLLVEHSCAGEEGHTYCGVHAKEGADGPRLHHKEELKRVSVERGAVQMWASALYVYTQSVLCTYMYK